MPDAQRIRAVIERMLETGETPEQACRDEPHLLEDVRAQWRQLQQVEAQVEAIFPSSAGERIHRHRLFAAAHRDGVAMPAIDGYRIERLIGHGGMGAVYLAQHLKLNRPVAIKMMLAGAYASPQELARFMREAEAVAAVRHANIVQVYDIGECDGCPYFTLEFIEGGTLAEKLAGMPQPARDAAMMTATLARAVQVAHDAGIVHRDLKPSNILLTADGSPKIADFGLAQRFEGGPSLTLDGARVGSPSYMAPEQAAGTVGAFCPLVDVYTLGAILYEMLTGRPPFRADTASETQRQVLHEEVAPPCRLNVRVPRDLETICMKCLRKEPRSRYASASALGDDLDRFLRGEPIVARPIGTTERGLRWVRRNPIATMLALAVTLLATLAVLVGVREWNRAIERRADESRSRERLHDATRLMRDGRVGEARLILDDLSQRRTRGDIEDGIARALRELSLVDELERIRLDRSGARQQRFDQAEFQKRYEAAFAAAGLNVMTEPTDVLAERVTGYGSAKAIIIALDDWALCCTDMQRCRALLNLARSIDPDRAWRDRVRDPLMWRDRAMLATLAEEADVEGQSVPLMIVLASLIDSFGDDATPFMRRVQRAHADDFWASFLLAELLDARDEDDAMGFYRAAIAARPDAVSAHVNLANMLARRGRLDEAMEHFNRALAIDEAVPLTHFNIAVACLNAKRPQDAERHARRAVEIDPDYAHGLAVLGCALDALEQDAQAIVTLQKSLERLAVDDEWRRIVEVSLDRLERR